jgi:hypothetical protein
MLRGQLVSREPVKNRDNVKAALLWTQSSDPHFSAFAPLSQSVEVIAKLPSGFEARLYDLPPHEALIPLMATDLRPLLPVKPHWLLARGILVFYLDHNDNGALDLPVGCETESVDTLLAAAEEMYVYYLEGSDAPFALADITLYPGFNLVRVERHDGSRPIRQERLGLTTELTVPMPAAEAINQLLCAEVTLRESTVTTAFPRLCALCPPRLPSDATVTCTVDNHMQAQYRRAHYTGRCELRINNFFMSWSLPRVKFDDGEWPCPLGRDRGQ